MALGEKFRMLADEWAEHCRSVQRSSNTSDYLRHPAYRQLIELGPAAVPLIMERYPTEQLLPWEFVVQEITGVRFIEDPTSFEPTEVHRRRLEWWEANRPGPGHA